jgi:hypothetical protein
VLHPTISAVSQLVYESMRLSAGGERSYFFRDRPHSFDSYGAYVGQLEQELRALWANATSSRRQRPLRAVTTTSRGYDSPAVTALVTSVISGVEAWTAPRSNTRIPGVLRGLMQVDVLDDDGSGIARRLGAEPRALDVPLEALPAELEAWCWASAQISPELAFAPLLSDAAEKPVPAMRSGAGPAATAPAASSSSALRRAARRSSRPASPTGSSTAACLLSSGAASRRSPPSPTPPR